MEKSLAIDFTLTMQWFDPRIKTDFSHGKSKDEGILISPNAVDKIWTPDLRIFNRTSFHVRDEWYSLTEAKVKPKTANNFLASTDRDEEERLGTMVQITYEIKTSVFCAFHYSRYPMDTQTCDVAFGSGSLGSIFVLHKSHEDQHENQGYRLGNLVMQMYFFDNSIAHGKNTIGITIRMERLTNSYLIKYYVPCMGIVLVSEIGFVIPVTAIPGRIGLLVTQFLSLINLFIHQMVRIYDI